MRGDCRTRSPLGLGYAFRHLDRLVLKLCDIAQSARCHEGTHIDRRIELRHLADDREIREGYRHHDERPALEHLARIGTDFPFLVRRSDKFPHIDLAAQMTDYENDDDDEQREHIHRVMWAIALKKVGEMIEHLPLPPAPLCYPRFCTFNRQNRVPRILGETHMRPLAEF